MSTELLTMQSIPGPRYRKPELDLEMASEITNLYNTQESWAYPSTRIESCTTSANYIRFNVPQTFTTEGRFEESLEYGQEKRGNTTRSSNERGLPRSISNSTTPKRPPASGAISAYTQPSIFTATNTIAQSEDMATISPVESHVDRDEVSARSKCRFLFDEPPRAIKSSSSTEHTASRLQGHIRQRSNSSQHSHDEQSPTQKHSGVGRRRKSELTVAGSARAIYLEKNRKAASKCRSKQKRQQEDLVEEARDVERRNLALRAEVEMLKSGMRELMDIVGQHTRCSDSRLKIYIQREADRLATGYIQTSL